MNVASPTAGASTLDAELAAAAEAALSTPRDAPVLLVCHVNPDGDALGSMLAVGLGLRRLGFGSVQATFPEPYGVAQPFRFLPGLDLLVPPDQAHPKPGLAISFDAASPTRLGELLPACEAAPRFLMLDHHASNTGFGSHRLLDARAAATAVIAAQLLDRLDVTYDREIATCLYVGLSTDTGSFKYDTTTPDVLALAARLVAAGAAPAEVALHVFDTRPFAAIRLLADVVGRAELEPDAAGGSGLVWTYATDEDLQRYGQPVQVLESFMDVIRTTAEADVACLIKPAGPRLWSVSLRSRGAINVAAAAVALGGGGHRLAAGFTGNGEVADVVAAVREELARSAASRP